MEKPNILDLADPHEEYEKTLEAFDLLQQENDILLQQIKDLRDHLKLIRAAVGKE